MARIVIVGRGTAKVELSRPDEDGDYSWTCHCGDTSDAVRPIDEAVGYAEVHVDIQCTQRYGRDR